MSFYNLGKPEDRQRYREDHAAELAAVENGTWPRDINDQMRWVHGRGSPAYAAEMCRRSIAYIDDLEQRIEAGDPDLVGMGYEPQPTAAGSTPSPA
jgi:hypothetical protein